MADSLTAASWLLLVSITASAVFLVLLPYSLWRLYRSSFKVQPSLHGKLKAAACALYTGIEFALLTRSARSSGGGVSSLCILEASLGLSASIGLVWLSAWAHKRSICPSSLITIYLLVKFVCCLLVVPASGPVQDGLSVFARPCSTFILLVLESMNKTKILLKVYTAEAPEATTSSLGNILFLWINPILARGYSRILSEVDIPVLDQNTSSKALKQAVLEIWDHRAKPEHGATLPLVLLRCLSRPFLGAVIPRVFVIVFRLSQPLIISRGIRFVTDSSAEDDNQDGYWIILAAATTYIGMALSTSVYQHRLNRLEVMARGALVGLLYNHTLEARGSDEEDGRVITLMSNDISNVEKSGEMFHETWGQASEVVVGTLLLSREVGWLWPAPLLFIFFCSRVSRYVAIHLKAEQGKWNSATQQRISVTSSMLGAMKNIKMLGMQQAAAGYVEHLRQQEMSAAEGVRWLMVAHNASANALGMFAPVLTIVLYVIRAGMRGDALDVEVAFTTIAILAMITHPANMVMTIVPRAVVSFSSFERIQAYILKEDSASVPSFVTSPELTSAVSEPNVAISLQNVNVTASGSSRFILRNININMFQGSITIITGPVGSGKTILARAVLGEIRIVSGSVCVHSKRIAYCSQAVWLPNQTIRDIIVGPGSNEDHDWAWYHASIQACCLDSDLDLLANGDLTSVGSKGSNLSGGQQQRVALARAVYSRCDIFVLDDSFSALDGKTQNQVIHNLLGPEGLLKRLGSTVLWISTAIQHFHLADDIAFLAEGTIQKCGTWEHIRNSDPQLLELIHTHDGASQALDTLQRDNPLTNREPTVIKSELESSRVVGDLSLYSYYFHASKVRNILLLITANALCAFFITIPSYWLKLWTDSPDPSTFFYTAIYMALLLAAWISTNGIMSSTLLLVAPTSGLVLHSRLLHTIVDAPLSYFSNTDTGSTLNLFSSDLQLVDKALAPALANLSTQVFKLLVQTTLLLLSQPLIALTLPPSILVVYIVQKVYLRTSRQLRILELSSRAAVLSSFIETVAGAPTIRAFGWQPPTTQHASDILDVSQRPLYLLLCMQRWLNVVLDLLVAAVAVAFVAAAVRLRTTTTGGEVGVALNVILVANTTLLKLVANWTDLEISLGAVARLWEVERGTAGEEELARPAPDLPEDWPARGEIVISDVTASYKASTVPSLKQFSLTIKAGQTVVVCGRTGSGKSSLLLSLLRLLDTEVGTITIDGVDITSLSRAMVRERVFITVAQSAFFLPQGSLRFNLDPEGRADTAVIVGALERTGLWQQFCGGGEREVEKDEILLSTPLSSLPTLSTGQTQLLAFARAVVRKRILCDTLPSTYTDMRPIKPIILLDEVTASLDPVTEGQIYDIIQEEFVDGGHTVVMVTHKLVGLKGRLRSSHGIVIWMSEGTVGRVGYLDERI